MAPEDEGGQGRTGAGPPPGSDAVPPDLTEIEKLSKKDQQILALRKQGLSQRAIASEAGLSRTAVRNHINTLVMRGFLDPSSREEEKDEGVPASGLSPAGQKATITGRALGAATAEAAKTAAELAVEGTDVFMRTGEWAWRAFNEKARVHGYDNIFAWLGDCVEYWETERQGWQSVLNDLHAARQDIEMLRDRVDLLSDWRELRQELLDAVRISNLTGHPLTGDQLSVLVTGRAPPPRPANALLALSPG